MALASENTAVLDKPLRPVTKDKVSEKEWFKKVSLSGELLFAASKAVLWKVAYSILWLIAAFLRGW